MTKIIIAGGHKFRRSIAVIGSQVRKNFIFTEINNSAVNLLFRGSAAVQIFNFAAYFKVDNVRVGLPRLLIRKHIVNGLDFLRVFLAVLICKKSFSGNGNVGRKKNMPLCNFVDTVVQALIPRRKSKDDNKIVDKSLYLGQSVH